jgi:hypothetical protein
MLTSADDAVSMSEHFLSINSCDPFPGKTTMNRETFYAVNPSLNGFEIINTPPHKIKTALVIFIIDTSIST